MFDTNIQPDLLGNLLKVARQTLQREGRRTTYQEQLFVDKLEADYRRKGDEILLSTAKMDYLLAIINS